MFRCDSQLDLVSSLRPALGHLGAAVVLGDDDLPLVGPGHAQVEAVGDDTVVTRVRGRDAVIDLAAGAVDVARHHVAGNVSGLLDGGGGSNTLDYAQYTTAVNVNLATGVATGTGGVANINNVTGTPSNDTITANAAGGVINGNGGQDFLGGGGNVTFVLSLNQAPGTTVTGAGGANTLQGADIPNTWLLTGPDSGSVDSITFSGIANLVGGLSSDNFQFQPGGSVSGTIDGGSKGWDNTLDYFNNGFQPVTINLGTRTASQVRGGLSGAFANIQVLVGSLSSDDLLIGPNVDTTWKISGPNSGQVGAITFNGFENLQGGSGTDVFQFQPQGAIYRTIDAGGAPAGQGNWLDYSAVSYAVTVDLAAGSAINVSGSGVPGTVKEIQNVHGGNGGNTLTGNAQGNILIGGTGANTITGGSGRSLLIADKGASSISGGAGGLAGGGDILIGGWTSYDTMTAANEAALMAILAEWQSTDSYPIRFSAINNSTGSLKGKKLSWGTTVQDNGKANALTAQAGPAALDWFFANTAKGHSAIDNWEAGEYLNNNKP
jgi:hypothetical protein